MSTKEKILQTAVSLFNQYGTARITTNHIAKEAAISPGNLYYHYQDKAHIIREVYEQMLTEWDPVYIHVEQDALSLAAMRTFIEENFQLLWQYRFFSREMVALLQADPVLAQRHFAATKQRYQRQALLLQKAISDGLLHFMDSHVSPDNVLAAAWIIANHFLNHLESMGQQVEQRDFVTGAELVMSVFSPYLSGSR